MTLLLEAPHSRPHAPPADHSAARPAPRASRRIPGLDLARFVACVGVIWLHFGPTPYNGLGYFRLPFFTLLLAFLAASGPLSGNPAPLARFVRTRVQRLLVPFVIWVLLHRLGSLAFGGRLPASYSPDAFLLGLGAVHLWYLPFAFLASLVAYALARACALPSPRTRPAAGVALSVVGLAAAFAPLQSGPATYAVHQWIPLAGAVLLGLALPLLFPALPRAPRSWARAALWASLAAVLAAASAFAHPSIANFLGTLAGTSLFLAGLAAPLTPSAPLWKYLGQLSYGMYLCHLAIGHLLFRLGLSGPDNALLGFFLVVAGSMLVSATLLRLPWGRFLLGLPVSTRRIPTKTPSFHRPISA